MQSFQITFTSDVTSILAGISVVFFSWMPEGLLLRKNLLKTVAVQFIMLIPWAAEMIRCKQLVIIEKFD